LQSGGVEATEDELVVFFDTVMPPIEFRS